MAQTSQGMISKNKPLIQKKQEYSKDRESKEWLLILPGTLWMILFVGVPLISVLIFSFWSSGFYGLVPAYSLNNYRDIFGDPTFYRIVLWTFEVVAIVLVGVLLLSYPAAYAIWRVVKTERIRFLLLMLMIIPFWTSYLTRTITWLPMFGREGVVNKILLSLRIVEEPVTWLLYSPYSMIFALCFLFIVFMIGPLYFSMTRIESELLDASAMLGANTFQTFWQVIFPLTKPGLAAGSLFVVVVGLGEFFTEKIIGGAQRAMMAGLVMLQIYVFQWAKAAAVSVILVIITLIIVAFILRAYDIRKI